MTGGRILARVLHEHGVEVVFGLPGVQIMPIYDGIYEQPDIRLITVRHEQTAVYMADGYARTTGRPGVALVVPGPGVYNAGAALATAYAASSPVLVIAGQVDSQLIGHNYDALHQLNDQLDIVKPVTKWRHRVMRADDIAGAIDRAMHELATGRPRPVVVEIPADVLAASGSAVSAMTGYSARPGPAENDIATAAALLAAARRPLIWAGGGAVLADASAELRIVAERLGALVLTTPEGRGAMPDDHPLQMGVTSAIADLGAAAYFVPQADVIFALGTRLSTPQEPTWAPSPRQRLIHLDIDQDQMGRFWQPTLALVGDVRLILQQLIEALEKPLMASEWSANELASYKVSWRKRARAALGPYESAYAGMRDALGTSGIVISGVNGLGYGADAAFPVLEPRTWITSSYMGTLGFEVGTALGAKVGNPDRPVAALVGDGGFLYGAVELATAVQYGINVIIVIYNNSAFGTSNNDQRSRYQGRVIGTILKNPELVAFTHSFGAIAIRVDAPEKLPDAVAQAVRLDKPTVIELLVPTGEMPMNIYGPLAPPRPR